MEILRKCSYYYTTFELRSKEENIPSLFFFLVSHPLPALLVSFFQLWKCNCIGYFFMIQIGQRNVRDGCEEKQLNDGFTYYNTFLYFISINNI